MKNDKLIPAEEICLKYKVEHTFISTLNESGLIEVIVVEEEEFVRCDHLAQFEKLRRMYYDLHINYEGLEAINHLLERFKKLQKKNQQLSNRLNLYE